MKPLDFAAAGHLLVCATVEGVSRTLLRQENGSQAHAIPALLAPPPIDRPELRSCVTFWRPTALDYANLLRGHPIRVVIGGVLGPLTIDTDWSV